MAIQFAGYKIRGRSVNGTMQGNAEVITVRADFVVTSLADFARVLAGLRSLSDPAPSDAAPIKTNGAVAPSALNLGAQKCEPAEAPAPPKDEVAKKREQKKAKAAEPMPPKAEEPPPESEQDDDEDEEPEPVQDGKDAASAIVEKSEAPATKPKAKFTPKMTDPDARFSDVVVELHKQGFHDPKDIAALCEKVHEKVPAVKKVKVEELAKRVERVFEIEGLS